MIADKSYSKALLAAILFHCLIAFLLVFESQNTRPALTQEAKNEAGDALSQDAAKKVEPEIVKAVSVDKKELMQTVNRLKEERAHQIKVEQTRQANLTKQADMARKERLQEQKHLEQLKIEADAIALKRKKEIEEEKKHLEQLAKQKEEESKRLEVLKKEQAELEKKKKQETIELAALKKKQTEQALKDSKDKAEKAEKTAKAEQTEKLEKAKAQLENKLREESERAEAAAQNREAAAREAAAQASQRAKMAGEVDKYKALILNAISQRWILPEHLASGLSSVFRIRLAPDGAVIDVNLTQSSGDPILDRSAQAAIFKASPLPVPSDPVTFDIFRDISLTVRPENVRG